MEINATIKERLTNSQLNTICGGRNGAFNLAFSQDFDSEAEPNIFPVFPTPGINIEDLTYATYTVTQETPAEPNLDLSPGIITYNFTVSVMSPDAQTVIDGKEATKDALHLIKDLNAGIKLSRMTNASAGELNNGEDLAYQYNLDFELISEE